MAEVFDLMKAKSSHMAAILHTETQSPSQNIACFNFKLFDDLSSGFISTSAAIYLSVLYMMFIDS